MRNLLLYVLAFVCIISANAQYKTDKFIALSVPQYACGTASSGSTRSVLIWKCKLSQLRPNHQYKYIPRLIQASEINSTSLIPGAGNPMFIDSGVWKFTSGPAFATGANHDTFTTSPAGDYDGFFGVIITNNTARFAPGKYTYPTITLLSVSGSPLDTQRILSTDSVLMLNYDTAAAATGKGTAIWGKSLTPAKSFIMLHDNTTGSGRPIATTYSEDDKITGIGSLWPYYTNNVDGKNGNWGAWIPNNLANGVRRVSSYSVKTGALNYANTDADGVWAGSNVNTKNPSGGAVNPKALTLDDAALTATVIEFEKRTGTVAENASTYKVYITRKYSSSDTQKVQLNIAGGTAQEGSGKDYTFAAPKTIAFPPGPAGKDSVSITINDDVLGEGDETIVLNLTNPVKCVLGIETAHTITISDNDIAKYSFVPNVVSVKENAGVAPITIKTNLAVGSAIPIKLLIKSKSATCSVPGEIRMSFANANDTTVNIGKTTGSDSVVVKVKIFDDIAAETDDTLKIVMRTTNNTIVLADSILTLVLRDNDGPFQAKFDVSALTVNENAGNIKVKVRLPKITDAQADLSLRYIGTLSTASNITDFNYPTSKVWNLDNTTPDSLEVNIPLIDDDNFENKEIAKFTLFNLNNFNILKPDTLTVTIISNDLPLYPIATVNKQSNAAKTADSINVACRVRGIVHGGNMRASGLNFTVIDGTGGIGAFHATKTFGYTVQEGDSVTLIGKVGQFQGTAQMNLDSVIRIGSALPTKNAKDVTKIDESTESNLVRMKRVKLVDAAEWPTTALAANGFKYVRIQSTNGQIDTLNIDAETNIDGTTAPSGWLNVTGIGVQFDNSSPFTSKYYLTPRYLTDIVPATLPKINFTKLKDTVTELADSFTLKLSALGTDENFNVDVVRIGGTAISPTDYDYNTKTANVLKFNAFYFIKGNISDDANGDGTKTVIFAMRNIQGPGEIGKDSVMTLVILDNEAFSTKTFNVGDIKMYPNPSNGKLTIAAKMKLASVELVDMQGRKVLHTEIYTNNVNLQLGNLAKGVYTVYVRNSKGEVFADKVVLK